MTSLYDRMKRRLSEMSSAEKKAGLDRVDEKMRAAYEGSGGTSGHVVGGAADQLPSLLLQERKHFKNV